MLEYGIYQANIIHHCLVQLKQACNIRITLRQCRETAVWNITFTQSFIFIFFTFFSTTPVILLFKQSTTGKYF
jgi:hypothetical protein